MDFYVFTTLKNFRCLSWTALASTWRHWDPVPLLKLWCSGTLTINFWVFCLAADLQSFTVCDETALLFYLYRLVKIVSPGFLGLAGKSVFPHQFSPTRRILWGTSTRVTVHCPLTMFLRWSAYLTTFQPCSFNSHSNTSTTCGQPDITLPSIEVSTFEAVTV